MSHGLLRRKDVAIAGGNRLGIAAQNAQPFRFSIFGDHQLREIVGPSANGRTNVRFQLMNLHLGSRALIATDYEVNARGM